MPDATGREPKVLLWCFEGDDVLGLVPRLEKVASTCEKVPTRHGKALSIFCRHVTVKSFKFIDMEFRVLKT